MFIRSSLVAVGVTALLCTAPALAQHTRPGIPLGAPAPATAPDGRAPGSVSTTTNSPTGERGAGIDSYHAVNPAPGAGEHPYVGHSEDAFYHVRDRIARVEQRAGGLRGSERRRALSGIRSIRAELARQVQEGIGQLPPDYAAVLALRYGADLDYTAIADTLNVPVWNIGAPFQPTPEQEPDTAGTGPSSIQVPLTDVPPLLAMAIVSVSVAPDEIVFVDTAVDMTGMGLPVPAPPLTV